MERFLYRLSLSPHKDKFILKGALVFNVWGVAENRSTRDIDFLGRTSNQTDRVAEIFREICDQPVEHDGIVFDPDNVQGEEIVEGADYSGVRITFSGLLGKAKIPIQVDIGFSDVVHPEPIVVDYPVILGAKALRLTAYTMESAIAEKLEAMTKLNLLNSRLKDFYDIWALSRQFQFRAEALREAVALTFRTRGTKVNTQMVALQKEFFDNNDKLIQWEAFSRRNPSLVIPPLHQVMRVLTM
jgi:predicted nucleotidyltransferase component of viral defense system